MYWQYVLQLTGSEIHQATLKHSLAALALGLRP